MSVVDEKEVQNRLLQKGQERLNANRRTLTTSIQVALHNLGSFRQKMDDLNLVRSRLLFYSNYKK